MAKTVATILGAVLVLIGLVGFIINNPDHNEFLGAHLTTNHNIVHLLTGAISLYLGLKGTLSAAKLFCLVFGAVYLLLGLYGFISGVVEMAGLHLETADHVIHLLLGVVYLFAGATTKADATAAVGA